jgi:acetyltransferase-like isoleucine patch superfamily enzyme
MGPHSKIGNRNWITGSSSLLKRGYTSTPDRKCEFIVGEHTRITAEHYFDCNGGIYVGRFTTVAGIQSQVFSHGIDINDSVQRTSPVHIGDYCFVGTRSILLKGSALPSFSVLGAGSTLNKHYAESYRLYAGNPAREMKKLRPESRYFARLEGNVR